MTSKTERRTINLSNKSGEVKITYSVCDFCMCEQADPDELEVNKECMSEFMQKEDEQL